LLSLASDGPRSWVVWRFLSDPKPACGDAFVFEITSMTMMINSFEKADRPHRFALGEAPPLQAIVRRIGSGEAPIVAESDASTELNGEFFADLIDFSNKGMKLSMPFQVYFEEEFLVRLEFAHIDYVFETEAVIKHIRMDSDRWVAGCSISPTIPHLLVDYIAETIGKERRAHPRSAVSGQGFIKREGDAQARAAEILDLSEGGFKAKIGVRPLLSERVKFLVYDKSRNLKQITARIRWVKQIDDEEIYLVGSSFAEESGYQMMRAALGHKPEVPLSAKRDFIGWFVIAACLLCMILPSVTSFAYGTIRQYKMSELVLSSPQPQAQGASSESNVDAAEATRLSFEPQQKPTEEVSQNSHSKDHLANANVKSEDTQNLDSPFLIRDLADTDPEALQRQFELSRETAPITSNMSSRRSFKKP